MIPLQIAFSDLVEPAEFTTSLAILTVFLLFIIANIAYQMRHPLIFIMLFLTITVLMFTIVVNLSFIWFWIMIVLTFLTIALAATIRYAL